MRKFNVFCVFAILVSLLFGAFSVYCAFFRREPVTVVAQTVDTAPQVTLTVETLYELVQPCSKLVSESYDYTNSSSITDCTEFWGHKVPFTTDEIAFTYTGTIYAGVDLSDVRFDVNEGSKSIYVFLPQPTIISHSIDTSSFVFDTKHDGFFTEITPPEFVSKANLLKHEQEAAAISSTDLLDRATESAKSTLRRFLITDATRHYTPIFVTEL